MMEENPVSVKIREEIMKLFEKYPLCETKEVFMSNTDIVRKLYDMVCEYHHLDNSDHSEMTMIETIEKYKDEVKLYEQSSSFKCEANSLYNKYLYDEEYNLSSIISAWLNRYNEISKDFLDPGSVNYFGVFKGAKQEIMTMHALHSLLPEKDYRIWSGYRHKTESDALSKTSENDLLILCRKGLFTVEIKSGKHEVTIQSSGTTLFGKEVADKNPVEQCIRHKFNLTQMINKYGIDLGERLHAALFLENCKSIDNQFNQIEAYNSMAILANSIVAKPDVLSEEEMTNLEQILNENRMEELKLKYSILDQNTYALTNDFLNDSLSLLGSVENWEKKIRYEQWVRQKDAEVEKNKIMRSVAVLLILSAAVILSVFCLLFKKETLDLSEYITVEFNGYDGYGTASVCVDWDAVNEEYGDKIQFSGSSKNLLSSSVITPVDALEGYLTPVLSVTEGLDNDETITCSWIIKNDTVLKSFNYKISCKDKEITVSGLMPMQKIDILSSIEKPYVVFSGSNGKTKATLNFNIENGTELYHDDRITILYDESSLFSLYSGRVISNNEEICEISIHLGNVESLSNGNITTLSISFPDTLLEMGYAPAENVFQYEVQNRPEVITSKDDIDTGKVIEYVQTLLPQDNEITHYGNLNVESIHYVSAKDTTVTDEPVYLLVYFSYIGEADYPWYLYTYTENRCIEIYSYYYEDGRFLCDEETQCFTYNKKNAEEYIEKKGDEYDFIRLY